MRAAHICGPNDIQMLDVPTPKAGSRDVVIKVVTAGICGSDLGFVKNGGLMGPTDKPLPIGHELCGIVEEVGGDVKTVRAGEPVILNPLLNMIGTGGPEGGFAERLLVRDVASQPDMLLPLPSSLSFEAGALAEPLAVAMNAVARGAACANEKAAIFGAGPIGLGIILALRERGIDDVIVFEPSALRRERALALGARLAVDPLQTPAAQVLLSEHGTSMFHSVLPVAGTDLFFDAAGPPNLLPEITFYAKPRARIVAVAVPKGAINFDLTLFLAKELSLAAALGYGDEFPRAIDLLSRLGPASDHLVSHRYSGQDINTAFQTAMDAHVSAKVLINF